MAGNDRVNNDVRWWVGKIGQIRRGVCSARGTANMKGRKTNLQTSNASYTLHKGRRPQVSPHSQSSWSLSLHHKAQLARHEVGLPSRKAHLAFSGNQSPSSTYMPRQRHVTWNTLIRLGCQTQLWGNCLLVIQDRTPAIPKMKSGSHPSRFT